MSTLKEELNEMEKRAVDVLKEEQELARWITDKSQNKYTLEVEKGDMMFLEAARILTYSMSKLEQVRQVVNEPESE